jgi:hypothetical protein
MVGQLSGQPIGSLLEKLIGVRAADEARTCAVQNLEVVAWLAGSGHSPFTSTPAAS